jgi:hypothetical protein
MGFDVGQIVVTPAGRAMVTDSSDQMVRTTVGSFKVDSVMTERDWEILQDPANVDGWLEGEFDEEVAVEVEVDLVDVTCKCECNQRQRRCHRVLHVARDGEVRFRSDHQLISTDCRCAQGECSCLTG